MICLNDFEEEIAEKMRMEEGILKKDVVKELVFDDGEMKNFGFDVINDVVIPLDEIDNEAFTIYNRDGKLYLDM